MNHVEEAFNKALDDRAAVQAMISSGTLAIAVKLAGRVQTNLAHFAKPDAVLNATLHLTDSFVKKLRTKLDDATIAAAVQGEGGESITDTLFQQMQDGWRVLERRKDPPGTTRSW